MKRFLLAAILAVTSLTGVLPAHADLKEADSQYVAQRNYVQNPGFENALSKWTASGGSFTRASSGSNLVTGASSGVWDSSAAAQTLSNVAFTIPVALKSKMGIAQCNILTPSGTATHLLQVYDGSVAVASQTVQSSTTAKLTRVPFKFPSSGTLRLRLLSVNANEPAIAIDDCFVGEWTSAVSMTTTERDAVTTPLAGIVIYNSTLAQVQYYNGSAWVSVGANLGSATSLNASAAFQVDSTTGGVLIPRMTQTQRDAIGSPATGLQIYNTDTNQANYYNGTAWLAVGAGGSGGGGVNLLDNYNGDSESGTSFWTASGGSLTNESSSPLHGLKSLKFNSSATSQTLTSQLVTMPEGFVGRKCQIHIPYYKYATGTDGDYTIKVLDGSSNVLSGPDNLLVTTSTVTFPYFNVFDCPASGSSMKVVITSTADAGDLILDDIFLGQGRNTVNASQAVLIGSAYFATTASCTWTRANTALGAFSTTAACPGPTVDQNPGPGTIQTTDVDLPKVTVNNLPVGRYEVCFIGNAGASTTMNSVMAINDGSTTSNIRTGGPGGPSGTDQPFHVCSFFSYTSTANRTFELYTSSDNGTVSLSNSTANRQTGFYIVKYPTNNVEGYTYDTQGSSWSGYHDSTCSWASASASFADPTADSTCVFTELRNTNFGTVTSALSAGNKLPGITFTPKRIGTYFVCVDIANRSASTGGTTASIQMVDGSGNVLSQTSSIVGTDAQNSSLCGFYYASAVASDSIKIQSKITGGATQTLNNQTSTNALTWKIFSLDQGFPAPVFNTINKKVDSNVTGTKVGSATVNSGCTTFGSNAQSMIASAVSNSTGNCTITLTTGYFSSAPTCICTPYETALGRLCEFDKNTPITATTIRTNTMAAASATAVAVDFTIMCMGQ